MKKILIIALLALLTVNINCGGGGGGSSGGAGTSLVTINIGNSSSGKAMSLIYEKPSPYVGIATIPPDVYKIVFTIAAPDMPPITKEVLVAGQETITETFSVPNGDNRYFHVEAKNASGLVLYQGDITADLVGEPVILIIYMTAVDTTGPAVISTIPPNGATEVSITLAIIITFSETIDPATFNSSTFTLRDNGSDVAGTIAVNGAVVTFTPSSDLAYDTTYTGTITTGVRDLRGNPMAENYMWSFMTGVEPGTTPPTVTGVSPGIGATDVPVTSTLTATFSKAMDESTINISTFTLVDGDSNPVDGTVTYADTTATFTPSSNLAPGMTYTARVTTGVRDLAGNAMAEDYTWSFTTVIEDTIPPSFGGLASATPISTTWQVQLQWPAATDNVTPSSNITYLIYMATTSGGQNYASPLYAVIGATTTTIAGLTPCTTYYFVVRARDAALNTETNTVERSATTQCLSWAKTYGGGNSEDAYSIQQTSDGGYIVAGITNSFGAGNWDFWVLKIDSTGAIQWQRTYGGTSEDWANAIQQTSDGGYIVAGHTFSFGAGQKDIWVLKLDSTGGIQYQRTYGGTLEDEAYAVQQTSDGGYIVVGFTLSFGAGGYDTWVLKLNSDLTVNWQRIYGGTMSDDSRAIRQTSDGGYIVAGATFSFGAGSSDIWVLKLDSAGVIQWQITYGGTGTEFGYDIQRTSDGGYIVACATNSFGAGNWDFWVLKLDSTGTIQWQRAYGGTGDDRAYTIQQTSDGGYIVAGMTWSFGAGSADMWVLKLNSDLTVNWQRTYGGTNFEWGQSIQQASDGGYIFAGRSDSFGAFAYNSWILKLFNDGTLGCVFGAGTTATVTNTGVSGAGTTAAVNTPAYTLTNTAITGQNSSATVGTQCDGGGFIDLQPTSASIVVGPPPGVSYTVTNNGTTAANVTVWVEYGDACSTVCSPRTITVPASGTFSDPFVTSPITPTVYTIVVDPNNTVSESDESNNCLDSGAGGCSFPPAVCP